MYKTIYLFIGTFTFLVQKRVRGTILRKTFFIFKVILAINLNLFFVSKCLHVFVFIWFKLNFNVSYAFNTFLSLDFVFSFKFRHYKFLGFIEFVVFQRQIPKNICFCFCFKLTFCKFGKYRQTSGFCNLGESFGKTFTGFIKVRVQITNLTLGTLT